MGIFQDLSGLALDHLIGGLCKGFARKAAAAGVVSAVGFLGKHFTDHSQKLTEALRRANERAWKSLEIALAGDSFWARCKALLAQADQRAVAEQVKAFLDTYPLGELAAKIQFRQECLRELQGARKAGILVSGTIESQTLVRRVDDFQRFTDPQSLVQAEWQTLKGIGAVLRQSKFPNLGWLVEQRPSQGAPLLVVAVRYFFRQEVETDAALARGLEWTVWENMAEAQQKGFDALRGVLTQNAQRVEALLQDIVGKIDLVEKKVEVVHQRVLDIRGEIQGQREQIGQLGQMIVRMLDLHQMSSRELRPRDSLSIRTPEEREQVKHLLEQYRGLSKGQQDQLPALLNGLGKLQHAVGNFPAAQRIFGQVARVVTDARARAEAHHNTYLASLESRQWDESLVALKEAVRLDPDRFRPFRLDKYEPVRILGAGGFGVAFLCHHRIIDRQVVIKTLRVDDLGRDAADVIREAQLMVGLNHEAIVHLLDCDYVDDAKSRLFLVMEYFDGLTLTDYVKQHGCVKPAEVMDLFRQVAEGLQAAHKRGILHRDVKPDNLLIRREEAHWQVKLIDFGLALKDGALQLAANTVAPLSGTILGQGIAGTVNYAAPEQMGLLEGVTVGPRSDIYGFGKTCCYALFKTPHPLGRHWRKLPETLSKWLDGCLEETPEHRPLDFTSVLKRLSKVCIRRSSPPRKARTEAGKSCSVALPPAEPLTAGTPKVSSPPAQTKSVEQFQGVPRLIVVRGAKTKTEYLLHEGPNVIGRNEADVDLSEQEPPGSSQIATQHCLVRFEGRHLSVEVLPGANGAFLNRERIAPDQNHLLQAGDLIQIGTVQLRVAADLSPPRQDRTEGASAEPGPTSAVSG